MKNSEKIMMYAIICLAIVVGIVVIVNITTTLESIVFSTMGLLLLILGIILAMPEES